MSRSRKIKILTIVALVIAIASMSLGFAAFSAALNISSSATVSPNSSDFKMKMYGFDTVENAFGFVSKAFDYFEFDESLLSEVNTIALSSEIMESGSGSGANGSTAYIDNSTMSISNMNVTFSNPSDLTIQYIVIIKNIGKYTAYFNSDEFELANSEVVSFCEGLEGTTPALAAAACDNIYFYMNIISSQGESLDSVNLYIKPDDFIMLCFEWQFSEGIEPAWPDGPIKYTVSNLKLPFTTAPNNISE